MMGYLLNALQALSHTSPNPQNRVEWSLPRVAGGGTGTCWPYSLL